MMQRDRLMFVCSCATVIDQILIFSSSSLQIRQAILCLSPLCSFNGLRFSSLLVDFSLHFALVRYHTQRVFVCVWKSFLFFRKFYFVVNISEENN